MILGVRTYITEKEIDRLLDPDTPVMETQMIRVKTWRGDVFNAFVDKEQLVGLLFPEEDSRAKD